MKFLIDHNLSPKLVKELQETFPGTLHTLDLQFDRTPDIEIWKYAIENEYHILTKDTDFEQLSMLCGTPPKVVWLRIGNAPTTTVKDVLRKYLDEIMEFLNAPERSLLALSL